MFALIADSVVLACEELAGFLPVMVAGVFLAELLVAVKAVGKVASFSRPLTNFAHLREECGISFMTAFLSPQAANAMLVDYHAKEMLSQRELVLAALMNSFPTVVMHWRYLLPVYIPLLGIPGLIYFGLLVLAGFIKTGLVMVTGRAILEPVSADLVEPDAEPVASFSECIRIALKSSKKTLLRLVSISVPTIFLMALLLNAGAFDRLSELMQGAGSLFPIPPEGFAIIAAQFASFIAGASVASTLLVTGTLTWQQVILALLAGNILTSITRTIRWFGSSYIAIFGFRTGTEIMLISTCLRNGILAFMLFSLAYGVGWI